MASPQQHGTEAILRRFLATGSAIMVFALGLMAVCPSLHDWVHGQFCESTATQGCLPKDSLPNDSDHACAVVGFAQGLTLAIDTAGPAATPIRWEPALFSCPTGHVPVEQHDLLPPGRAPPASLS